MGDGRWSNVECMQVIYRRTELLIADQKQLSTDYSFAVCMSNYHRLCCMQTFQLAFVYQIFFFFLKGSNYCYSLMYLRAEILLFDVDPQ